MVTQLAQILGITVPAQMEPLLVVMAAIFLLFLVSFFAELLKLIIMRW